MEKEPYAAKSESMTLAQVFKQYTFQVPVFQRPYSWKPSNALDLLRDVWQASKHGATDAFFHTLILSQVSSSVSHYFLIDGQQRLVTFTLLLALLRDHFLVDSGGLFEQYLWQPAQPLEDKEAAPRIVLEGDRDKQFFLTNVQTPGGTKRLTSDKDAPTEPTPGQEALRENANALYLCLKKKFRKRDGKHSLTPIEFTKAILSRVRFFTIFCKNTKESIRLFSINNARGLPLDFLDILKAHLISSLKEDKWEDYARKWESLEAKLGRDAFREVFPLLQKLHANKNKKNSAKLAVMEPSEFFTSKHLGEKFDARLFLKNSVEPIALALQALDKPHKWTGCKLPIASLFLAISEYTEWKQCAVLVLAASAHTDFAVVVAEDRESRVVTFNNAKDSLPHLLSELERFTALAQIVRLRTEDRETLFDMFRDSLIKSTDWSRLVLADSFNKLAIERRRHDPEDPIACLVTAASRRLAEPVYNSTGLAKYLLLRFEALCATNFNYNVDQLRSTKKANQITIEHLLPQRPGDAWKKHWPDSARRDFALHRLGNLVPLDAAQNSAAGNKSYEQKLSYFFGSNGSKRVSTFASVSMLHNIKQWTYNEFEERHHMVVQKLRSLYSLPTTVEEDQQIDLSGTPGVPRATAVAPTTSPAPTPPVFVPGIVFSPNHAMKKAAVTAACMTPVKRLAADESGSKSAESSAKQPAKKKKQKLTISSASPSPPPTPTTPSVYTYAKFMPLTQADAACLSVPDHQLSCVPVTSGSSVSYVKKNKLRPHLKGSPNVRLYLGDEKMKKMWGAYSVSVNQAHPTIVHFEVVK